MDTVLHTVSKIVSNQETDRRPRVCLTWAQSLDGRLAMSIGSQTVISGSQSMQMTHALRALHESILVGVGTVISDNPRLTCRMDDRTHNVVDRIRSTFMNEPRSTGSFSNDPVPVILDSSLRTPPESRCLQKRSEAQSMRPLLFHQPESGSSLSFNKLGKLAQLIRVPLADNQHTSSPYLDLKPVLNEVNNRGISNIMVEGGASVISSFLDSGLWDIAVVTISGQLFRSGVTLHSGETKGLSGLTRFRNSKWVQVGNDMVFIGFPN